MAENATKLETLDVQAPEPPRTPRGPGSIEISRLTMFVIAWLLTWLTSGGLAYGFGPLYSRLVEEKQWHELCPANTTEVCSAQEVQLQSIYSTGILMTVLGQTVFGTLLDTIGPRYMTMIAYLFSIAGNICMAYGDSKNGTDGLIVAGYALIGFGGMGILYASLQLSQLFRDPEVFTSIMVAAFSCSGYVYVFLELQIARHSFYVAYAILVAVALVVVYLVFPVHHVVEESQTVVAPGFQFIRPKIDKLKLKHLWEGLKVQFKRRDIYAFICMGALLYLVIVFAGGAIPSIVTFLDKETSAHRKNEYTNYLYPLLSNSAFLFSPIAGYLLGKLGFRKTIYVAIFMYGLLCGSFMLPSLPAQNLSFVLMAVCQAFLNTVQYVYVMHCFPHELYGMLSGIITLLVFAYCLLSYALTPLAQYTFDGNNNYIFLILLGTTFLSAFLVRFLREESECIDEDLRLNLLENRHDDQTSRGERHV
ncbi:unnamed protein product [Aphanomyces euteiches]|uniref:Major facilitator superfamily (MFS) profile domain-containing protein n=1 Tax=Aphanomyces euteiches TaxID=100861 RepID=A0A6G0XHW6_9STRA|nr:hypothetical protein Ae201684_004513 [Aphanomyces euteiches]